MKKDFDRVLKEVEKGLIENGLELNEDEVDIWDIANYIYTKQLEGEDYTMEDWLEETENGFYAEVFI